ncbi:hypothetical protein SALB1_3491 [Salinisphaera sp. LB1]|nr:hypothetical protein SALB1_3491 [Salinisphaera sp. LB1]
MIDHGNINAVFDNMFYSNAREQYYAFDDTNKQIVHIETHDAIPYIMERYPVIDIQILVQMVADVLETIDGEALTINTMWITNTVYQLVAMHIRTLKAIELEQIYGQAQHPTLH